jgi:hypothetical protein
VRIIWELSPHNYGYRIMGTELWLQNYGYRIMVTELWLPSICDDAEKLRFIGILAYPKSKK